MNILSLFLSKNPKKYWLNLLLILGILLIIMYFYKKQNIAPFYEGFSQDDRFVTKFDSDVYDDFYVKIYDSIMVPKKRADYEALKIIEMTEPDKKSVFLDVGSGTGDLAYALQSKGYNVFGIDKSSAMVERANNKYPDVKVKCGDVAEPMLYESNTFTHILCMGMTIYEFNDKKEFLENSYFWLKSGGYLILNLVDKDKFDTIIPGGKPALMSNPQTYSEKRIKDTIIDFIDFEYKATYDFNNAQVVLKETFTDGLTKNVRQNERNLIIDDKETILNAAAKIGFLAKGFTTFKDSTGDGHQYLYILERPN